MRLAAAFVGSLIVIADIANAASVKGKSFSIAVPALNKDFSSLQARQLMTGSVTATPFTNSKGNDEGDYSPISIGGQQFNVLFDTGSAVDWVWGSFDGSGTRGDRPFYNPGPEAIQIFGEDLRIQYSDETRVQASDVYIDTVTIGGVSVITAFGAAYTVTGPGISSSAVSGIFGFAFTLKGNTNGFMPEPLDPWWVRALPELAQPVFCAYLKHDAVGAWDFGVINPARYIGTIQYADIARNDDRIGELWGFYANGIKVNGVAHPPPTRLPTFVDSGAPGITLDADLVRNYYENVIGASQNASGVWSLPCIGIQPDLQLEITNNQFITVPGSSLVGAPGDIALPFTRCDGLLQPALPNALQVYGLPVFQSHYVVHKTVPSLATAQIGFATQR
jgi:aspergillopepsin I